VQSTAPQDGAPLRISPSSAFRPYSRNGSSQSLLSSPISTPVTPAEIVSVPQVQGPLVIHPEPIPSALVGAPVFYSPPLSAHAHGQLVAQSQSRVDPFAVSSHPFSAFSQASTHLPHPATEQQNLAMNSFATENYMPIPPVNHGARYAGSFTGDMAQATSAQQQLPYKKRRRLGE